MENIAYLEDELMEAIENEEHFNNQKFIYSVNPEVLAKEFKDADDAEHEYNMNKFLAENRVQVPEMYGIVKVSDHWYILMQKVEGQNIADIAGAWEEESMGQFRGQIRKVLGLGICPKDSDFHGNAVFDPDNRKLYLIDLEQWRKGSPQELRETYDWVNQPDIEFR